MAGHKPGPVTKPKKLTKPAKPLQHKPKELEVPPKPYQSPRSDLDNFPLNACVYLTCMILTCPHTPFWVSSLVAYTVDTNGNFAVDLL